MTRHALDLNITLLEMDQYVMNLWNVVVWYAKNLEVLLILTTLWVSSQYLFTDEVPKILLLNHFGLFDYAPLLQRLNVV